MKYDKLSFLYACESIVPALKSLLAALEEVVDNETEKVETYTEISDVVCYTLPGSGTTPSQHVIESRSRVATRDDDTTRWWLRWKSNRASNRPLSDWDYEELDFRCSVASEEEAVFWVVTGKVTL